MLDLKQLKYFITCAETGSVSEAAKLLYTTQPSVSKVIKSLENDMGVLLFERMPRGITLTAKGREVYRYACRIVNDASLLEGMSRQKMTRWLRISLNPSSWFATSFVEFYKQNYEKNYHFEIYTAGVRTVMERVRDYLSDIGFVYLMAQQEEEFQYELTKNRLAFFPMQESIATFYPGKKNPLYSENNAINMEKLEGFRFIQNYQDEFPELKETGKKDAFCWNDLDVAVVTNSDYIMEKMLQETDLCNISGSYLSGNQKAVNHGIPLEHEKNKVVFGYIMRKNEETEEAVEELLQFLKGELEKEN